MALQRLKNIQFTKLMKVNGQLKEFNFRKPNSNPEGACSIDVIDDRGNRIIFKMEKDGESWKILPQQLPVPVWVTQQETVFSEAIEEALKAAM